jgi:signal transduction histidine kinase
VVDLRALGHDLADLYRPAAEDRQLTFEYRCAPGLHMRANRHLLVQALANLLDNAIKYTPPGGRVRLQIGRAASGPTIAVADNGPGIPEKDRERVLQRFVRLDATRSTPGNGLGLSLVDAVAKLHGARLSLSDNRPGLKVSLAFPAFAEERAPKAAA